LVARPIAIGRFEVTFEEWEACVADGGCSGYLPDDLGEWGRGRRPVIFVDWNDVHVYVEWLSAKTGARYRLLTEAEWEYATRAGTQSRYSWGEKIGTDNANCRGCGSRWDAKRTAPVGSFAPNQFGLHDMAGNVREWVEDCWHGGYVGAPRDGSAWTDNPDCHKRIVRGGAWGFGPESVQSAYRNWDRSDERMDTIGFRVARELWPNGIKREAN
jgi:formylglycine-generating enzyme required for sulfatase activity